MQLQQLWWLWWKDVKKSLVRDSGAARKQDKIRAICRSKRKIHGFGNYGRSAFPL